MMRKLSVSSDAFVAPNKATTSYLQHYRQDHARALSAREREAFSSTNCDCDLPSCVLLSGDYIFWTAKHATVAKIVRRFPFQLFAVTAQAFFHHLGFVARFDNQDPDRRGVQCQNVALEHTFCYLSKMALLEYRIVSERPSWVAAAALYLAKATTASAGVRQRNRNALWTKSLEHHTGHSARNLEPLVCVLYQQHAKVENNNL